MTEGESHDPVYYRIYLDKDDFLRVVCMQSFDEYDYHQERFLLDEKNEKMKWDDENACRRYLNERFKAKKIYADDRTPNNRSYQK